MKRRDLLKAIGVSSILPFVHIEAQAPQVQLPQAKQPQISADSGECLYSFSSWMAHFPLSNFPRLISHSGRMTIAFGDSTREMAYLMGESPKDFSDRLNVVFTYCMARGASGYVNLEASLERLDDSDNAFSVATHQQSAMVPASAGLFGRASITLTNTGSIKAGDYFRLRVSRNASSISDTAMGDLWLHSVELRKA